MADEGTTVVVGGDRGIGRALVEALAARGRAVGVVPSALDLADADAVRAELAAAAGDGAMTTAVLAHLDPAGFVATPLVALDEAAWDAAAERSLRAAVVVLQQIHAVAPDGAAVVVVLPTVAGVGVPGLVPLCTAVEGIRVMAKALARRWGARRITVNTVEVELSAFLLGDDEPGAGVDLPSVPVLGSPALPAGSVAADVAGLVDLLGSADAAGLTGALLAADRGTVMLP